MSWKQDYNSRPGLIDIYTLSCQTNRFAIEVPRHANNLSLNSDIFLIFHDSSSGLKPGTQKTHEAYSACTGFLLMFGSSALAAHASCWHLSIYINQTCLAQYKTINQKIRPTPIWVNSWIPMVGQLFCFVFSTCFVVQVVMFAHHPGSWRKCLKITCTYSFPNSYTSRIWNIIST